MLVSDRCQGQIDRIHLFRDKPMYVVRTGTGSTGTGILHTGTVLKYAAVWYIRRIYLERVPRCHEDISMLEPLYR